jgi:hypothetical protein
MPAKYKKRKDGLYCTHVTIGTKPDGTRHRKSVYAKTIRELEDKAAELRREVGIGAVMDGGNMSVSEWVDIWLNTYKIGVEYNTSRMYNYIVDSYIIPKIGHFRMKDVKTFH